MIIIFAVFIVHDIFFDNKKIYSTWSIMYSMPVIYRIDHRHDGNTPYKTRIPNFQNYNDMGRSVIWSRPNTLPIKTPWASLVHHGFVGTWIWSSNKQNQIQTRSLILLRIPQLFPKSITPLQRFEVYLCFYHNFRVCSCFFNFQFQLLGFWFWNS